MATHWHAPLIEHFSRTCWNDEYFLFNPASGYTHVLNQLSIDIIDLLGESPCGTPDILSHMIETWRVEADERTGFAQRIEEHLHQLNYLGLISDGTFDDTLLIPDSLT